MGADIKPGDRVKVTFEGTWDEENGAGVALTAGVKLYEGYALDAAKSIEKIEPPVEVFKPGDVVRARRTPGHIYSLNADGGYTYVGPVNRGLTVPFDKADPFWFTFTSDDYEKVSIE